MIEESQLNRLRIKYINANDKLFDEIRANKIKIKFLNYVLGVE